MKDKSRRLDAIRLIISNLDVSNQKELKEELQKEGYQPAQATLSRDLKELKVLKATNSEGKYRYVLPSSPSYHRYSELKPKGDASDLGFLSICFSNNIAVIHTRPSFAGPLAYQIDNQELPFLLGTIAGDDTILLVLSEGATRTEVMRQLAHVIPNI